MAREAIVVGQFRPRATRLESGPRWVRRTLGGQFPSRRPNPTPARLLRKPNRRRVEVAFARFHQRPSVRRFLMVGLVNRTGNAGCPAAIKVVIDSRTRPVAVREPTVDNATQIVGPLEY